MLLGVDPDPEPKESAGADLVDISAFGHRFGGYPAGLAEDLITLEKEGALYAHFADEGPDADGNWDFGYVRISLLPSEIYQFVEASLAYQEFHDALAQGADFDGAIRAISDPEIAERVVRYGDYGRTKLDDGTEIDIRGCHASFYPPGMEALVCGQRPDRYQRLPELGAERDRIALLMKLLNNLPVAMRMLRDRQRGKSPFEVEDEYDVQDLLFAILRSFFDDAKREEWTPAKAGSAKRIDILLPSIEVALEAKYVRSRNHAKHVADELRIDFECYHERPECKHLIAIVMDPNGFIADPAQFGTDLSGLRQKNDHSFEVTVLVR